MSVFKYKSSDSWDKNNYWTIFGKVTIAYETLKKICCNYKFFGKTLKPCFENWFITSETESSILEGKYSI